MLQLTLKRETETKRASERENINNVNTIVCLKNMWESNTHDSEKVQIY